MKNKEKELELEKELKNSINKKENKILSESDFQQIKIELSDVLQDYLNNFKKEIEKNIFEKVLNEITKRAFGISALIISLLIGIFLTFLGLHHWNMECNQKNIQLLNKVDRYELKEQVIKSQSNQCFSNPPPFQSK